MPTTPTIDVLIVGAGPTGTALAIDLARRGLSFRLIDKEPTAFGGSRAKGIQPRTLEVFDDLGVLLDVLNRGGPYPKMGIHLGPLTIPWRMIEKGNPGPDVPHPDTLLIPQNSTIRVLHERLGTFGAQVELGTELIEFATDATGITAQLSTSRGAEELTARYIVGADGGSSRVRKMAGIKFEGITDEADRMLIVDAAVDGDLSRTYWHVWPGARGRFVGACPLPHSELFQWMIRLAPDENPPSTAAEINEKVRSLTGNKKLFLRDINWQSIFRPNIRLAENYRRGRVFLAGDAAHVHTPAGAQGLNTGVGDAYNLGWKLGQVLAGAPDALLDTYETERRPIAAHVLGLSTKKFAAIGTLDPKSARRGKDEKQLLLTYHGGPLASPPPNNPTRSEPETARPTPNSLPPTEPRYAYSTSTEAPTSPLSHTVPKLPRYSTNCNGPLAVHTSNAYTSPNAPPKTTPTTWNHSPTPPATSPARTDSPRTPCSWCAPTATLRTSPPMTPSRPPTPSSTP